MEGALFKRLAAHSADFYGMSAPKGVKEPVPGLRQWLWLRVESFVLVLQQPINAFFRITHVQSVLSDIPGFSRG